MPSKLWVRYRVYRDGHLPFGMLFDSDADADFFEQCLGDVARLGFEAYYGEARLYLERTEA